ncbi:hypothetical protein TNCV_602271 [Trichonephila clavipes]|nr:hypothetical protein TNCV_602271 [Trichonephila clavipes]
MRKSEEIRDLGVLPGRGHKPVGSETVEVATEVLERAFSSFYSSASNPSVSGELDIPWTRNAALSELKKTLRGSQKRKIRKEKEYNINSKYAKLDNFFISASSSSCASASSSNAKELDEQILEVKINPQEKNTVSDTSTNKDTLSKEKESENENEETKLIRNDFAHCVGTPIDAELRE